MLAPRKTVIAALTLGVLVALGAPRTIDLLARRAELVRVSQARAGNLASILSEYLRGSFAAGDAALRQLALHSQRIGGPDAPDAEWLPSLASARAGLPGAGAMTVTDADGVIRHSNQPAIASRGAINTCSGRCRPTPATPSSSTRRFSTSASRSCAISSSCTAVR